jgi:hypothetical protein
MTTNKDLRAKWESSLMSDYWSLPSGEKKKKVLREIDNDDWQSDDVESLNENK